jgi:hypothetical protein
MLEGLNIYHVINFLALVIGVFVSWKKLKPKDYLAEITALQSQVKDLDRSIERIEASVEKIRDWLLDKGCK